MNNCVVDCGGVVDESTVTSDDTSDIMWKSLCLLQFAVLTFAVLEIDHFRNDKRSLIKVNSVRRRLSRLKIEYMFIPEKFVFTCSI